MELELEPLPFKKGFSNLSNFSEIDLKKKNSTPKSIKKKLSYFSDI